MCVECFCERFAFCTIKNCVKINFCSSCCVYYSEEGKCLKKVEPVRTLEQLI